MNHDVIFNILYGPEKVEIYHEFQKIENNIDNSDELYQYFDEIKNMLLSEKSFIRIRGFRIICKLARYDKLNKIDTNINEILNVLNDDYPSVVRQSLSSLKSLIPFKRKLLSEIKLNLKQIDYKKYKDTMSPLIKKDVDEILLFVEKFEI